MRSESKIRTLTYTIKPCFSDTRFACSRRSDSGVRREGREREKNKEEKRVRERGGNACEICFQKVILPTLSASNPNLVSCDKSCQTSNGWKTALLTKFWKNMPVFTFYICFLQANVSLTSKNERTGKHLKLVPLPLPLIFTQQIIYYVAAVGFCCYYWNAVWICLSVKSFNAYL